MKKLKTLTTADVDKIREFFEWLPRLEKMSKEGVHSFSVTMDEEGNAKPEFVYDIPEDKKKLLDKKPGHRHRAKDIILWYSILKKQHPEDSDLQIRETVCEIYKEVTGKELNEGTVRHYLDIK